MINVLVVDDQNLIHRLIETYLQPEPEIEIVGFANNGQEAIDRVAKLQPDIVLMDVEMPKMNGLTATKIIGDSFPSIKVLILTAHDNEQHFSKALQNGAKGYLLKTITAEELKNAIQYVNQGYFQLSVQLVEKYLYKIISQKYESKEEVDNLKKKVNHLHQHLDKLKDKLEKMRIDGFDRTVEEKIAQMLKTEMALLSDRDSHLQFKVDRMSHNQERLKKSVSYLFMIQLACIVAGLIFILYTISSNSN